MQVEVTDENIVGNWWAKGVWTRVVEIVLLQVSFDTGFIGSNDQKVAWSPAYHSKTKIVRVVGFETKTQRKDRKGKIQ